MIDLFFEVCAQAVLELVWWLPGRHPVRGCLIWVLVITAAIVTLILVT